MEQLSPRRGEKGWKSRVTGTWRIKGDQMCTEYDDEAWGGACHEFFDKGENFVITKIGRGTNKEMKFLLKIVGKGDSKRKALFYYHPDGTALSKAWGKGWKSRVTGTWRIKGDQMCTEYDDEAWGGACHEFFDKGENFVITKIGRGTNKEMKFLLKIVGKGNVKNLK